MSWAVSIGWWWWVLVAPPPEPPAGVERADADVSVSHRSVGYARNEVEYQCRRELVDQCGERGMAGPENVNWGGSQCHEDDDGWATCSVKCSGVCAERAAE